jgi:hypothetical protein
MWPSCGRRPPARFGTSIDVRGNGQWQVLQIQGTPMPPTPSAMAIDADILRRYAGRYQQDDGPFVTITIENGGLSLQVDGRQTLPLTPDSPTHFTLPAAAGEITFARQATARRPTSFGGPTASSSTRSACWRNADTSSGLPAISRVPAADIA